jgi:thiol-disulfide isomerase/thioredoxin
LFPEFVSSHPLNMKITWFIAFLTSLLWGCSYATIRAEVPAISPKMPSKKLGIGDAAPPLKVAKWVQGGPIQKLAENSLHVVEFWATWCPPCKATVPHLNELHLKFKDKGVQIIGVDCFENEPAKVEKFVSDMGAQMTYPVALDDFSQDENGEMGRTWMTAAKKNGIPCAFVIGKDGNIAWIGHPAKISDKMIEQLLDGSYKPDELPPPPQDGLGGPPTQEMGPNFGALHSAVAAAVAQKNWPAAKVALEKLKAAMPPQEQAMLALMEMDVALGNKETDLARQIAIDFLQKNEKNPAVLQTAAWRLATATKDPTMLTVAWDMTERALTAIPENGRPLVLHVRSRILFLQGKRHEAVQLLQATIPTAPERLQHLMQETLKAYEAGKLVEEQQ